MAAVKKAVFDQKTLTMGELVAHLRNNFAGAEELRQKLSISKYGNDDEYVDQLAVWIGRCLQSKEET